MKRVDYYSGMLFSTATIPGAILGALTTGLIPRRTFDMIVGLLLLGMSIFLFIRPAGVLRHHHGGYSFKRQVVEIDGTAHTYSYDPVLGVGVSLVVGYVSSVLGIGGGFIHVPAMVHLLNFPVHVAAATSHFTLAVMTFVGSAVHAVTGGLAGTLDRTVPLAIGVTIGAQFGARLARRVHGIWIIRALTLALVFVGIRLLISEL
ncbi:MAG TPA: sulfite exporter TauE/SafE family protein [Methylomirabilota bacterium]|nr:sulfite exporter TauE/SafE family protein [Methylomirabilota bacterium]